MYEQLQVDGRNRYQYCQILLVAQFLHFGDKVHETALEDAER